jgi:flagellar FliL protein
MASKTKAAKAAAPEAGGAPKASLGKTIMAVVVMTVLAAAGGGLYAIEIAPAMTSAKPSPEAKPKEAAPGLPANTAIKDLPPIVTNIAAPQQAWIRLEAAVVYDGKAVPEPDLLMREIGEDVLAFLRTLTLEQIQGVAGLRQLREDLNERVAIRSQGKARELLIQALIVQ